MIRNLIVLVVAAAVVALPFALRRPEPGGDWRPGDPRLVVVTPHNEAIRYEFGRAFSRWHQQHHGQPVKIEWLNIGGTTEISRYLVSEYVAAFRAWWLAQGRPWPAGAGEALVATRLDEAGDEVVEMRRVFRTVDDPDTFGVRIDLFFGGGEYDHSRAYRQGLTVPPWPDQQAPRDLLTQVPENISGEVWRTPTMIGTTVSTFGICYNRDRLRDLGVTQPPVQWADLAAPVYYRQIGVADPTKSGSIAKAFEMIIQQQIHETVRAAGFDDAAIERWENEAARSPAYESAVERGWEAGIRLVQRIGANARYFTDSASKVPIDVAAGDAAAGLAIDFYARFQARATAAERMEYVTPVGGSSVSCDPIGLLRGAPNRVVAVRFIEFVLSEEGQRLWTYRPGTPGGPETYALCRLPIRRDFYEHADAHQPFAAEDLTSPLVNPYALATQFTYRPRWTAPLFNVQRDLIRAMCLDAGEELRAAWQVILDHGGPAAQPAAVARLQRLPDRPELLSWSTARAITQQHDRLTYLREWTEFYRASYREAAEAVRQP